MAVPIVSHSDAGSFGNAENRKVILSENGRGEEERRECNEFASHAC
jgi:hypothetical protein